MENWKETLGDLISKYRVSGSPQDYGNVFTFIESQISQREERELKHLDNIETALNKLVDLGDIKCSAKDCGDEECAAVIIRNEINKARLELSKGKEKG